MRTLICAVLMLFLTGCSFNIEFYQPSCAGVKTTTVTTVSNGVQKTQTTVDTSNADFMKTSGRTVTFGKKTFTVGAVKSINSVSDYSMFADLLQVLK